MNRAPTHRPTFPCFGGNAIMVKGDTKVMGHLMFGVLALSADQLMRLRQ
jgi:hypothetical protein